MRDYAALVAHAREAGAMPGARRRPVRMTAAMFGKLLVAAWAARMGRSDLPKRDLIMAELLRAARTAPDEIRAVMHLEERLTGPVIAEYSEYMTSAQMDGLIKRYNPDYVRVAVEVDRLTGSQLLDMYTAERPEVRAWVTELVNRLLSARERGDDEQRKLCRSA